MKDSTTFADPVEAEKRARAIVKAATHFNDPKVLLEVSEDLQRSDEGAGCGRVWMRRRCCRLGVGSNRSSIVSEACAFSAKPSRGTVSPWLNVKAGTGQIAN